jgi:hypothetical protein
VAQRGDGRVDRVELGHKKWMNDQKERGTKERQRNEEEDAVNHIRGRVKGGSCMYVPG